MQIHCEHVCDMLKKHSQCTIPIVLTVYDKYLDSLVKWLSVHLRILLILGARPIADTSIENFEIYSYLFKCKKC